MPMLWRPHDHHRDFRTPDATPRAAAGTAANPDDGVVTRHGQPLLGVETYLLPTPNKRALTRADTANSMMIMQISACLTTLSRPKNSVDNPHRRATQPFNAPSKPSLHIRRVIGIYKYP
jgi:hypothetical protein